MKLTYKKLEILMPVAKKPARRSNYKFTYAMPLYVANGINSQKRYNCQGFSNYKKTTTTY